MLVIGLLVLILIVLVRHGRWKYFQENRLPNGQTVNYTKYAFFGVAVAFAGLLRGIVELLALGVLVWQIGPYVELEIAKINAEHAADDRKSSGAFSFLKNLWKVDEEPKDPQK